MKDYETFGNQMRELVSPVREYFPKNPEKAFDYFRKLYPEVVAGTIVTIVWGFIEYENSMKNPLSNTKPLTLKDMAFMRDPNILN